MTIWLQILRIHFSCKLITILTIVMQTFTTLNIKVYLSLKANLVKCTNNSNSNFKALIECKYNHPLFQFQSCQRNFNSIINISSSNKIKFSIKTVLNTMIKVAISTMEVIINHNSKIIKCRVR